MHKAYLLSGLSGVGKSTLGRYIEQHHQIRFVDQDQFFRSAKPAVSLRGGLVVNNWDCCEALDLEKMNNYLQSLLEQTDIILVGFCLRDEYLPALKDKIYNHTELIYGTSISTEALILKICGARAISKPYINLVTDTMIVAELVLPFYLETKRKSTIDSQIVVFSDTKRRGVDEIYKEWSANLRS